MRSFNSERKTELTDKDRKKYGPGIEAAIIEMRKDYKEKALLNEIQERKSNVLAEEFISD